MSFVLTLKIMFWIFEFCTHVENNVLDFEFRTRIENNVLDFEFRTEIGSK